MKNRFFLLFPPPLQKKKPSLLNSDPDVCVWCDDNDNDNDDGNADKYKNKNDNGDNSNVVLTEFDATLCVSVAENDGGAMRRIKN